MKNNDLLMCCFGNGTAVYGPEEGYGMSAKPRKYLAHISDHGVIKFYVPEDSIPSEALERIRKCAERDREKFMESWNRKTPIQKYEYMIEIPGIGFGGIGKFNYMDSQMSDLPFEKRLEILEEEFFKTHM